MARLALVVLALLIAIAVILFARRQSDSLAEPREANRDAPAQLSTMSPHSTNGRGLAVGSRHERIAERVAVVAAARARTTPITPTISVAVQRDATQAVTAALPDELQRVWPAVRACYETSFPDDARPEVAAEIDLTLAADPQLGTRVEADVLLDPSLKRLPGEMVDCLRSELSSLELPPLGEGDSLTVRQRFAFGPE